MNDDAIWLAIVSVGVFTSYLPHLFYSIRRYARMRSYPAFRGLFVAIMLQVGLLRIVLGASARATISPNTLIDILQAITAPALSLLLLTGGIVLALSWLAESRSQAKAK